MAVTWVVHLVVGMGVELVSGLVAKLVDWLELGSRSNNLPRSRFEQGTGDRLSFQLILHTCLHCKRCSY